MTPEAEMTAALRPNSMGDISDAVAAYECRGDERGRQQYLDAFLQASSFLRFSARRRDNGREPDAIPNDRFDSFYVSNAALDPTLTRQEQEANTLTLLCWLLSLYRREPNVCLVLDRQLEQPRQSPFPIIHRVDQSLTLSQDCRNWQDTLADVSALGNMALDTAKTQLQEAGYSYADFLQQVLIQWQDGCPRNHDLERDMSAEAQVYPLQIYVVNGGRQQKFLVRYDRTLVEKELVEGVFEKYQMLMHDQANYRRQRLCDIEILSTTDKYLLKQWNKTEKPYDLSRPYHQYVRDLAASEPESIAVEMGDERLTYHDLDRYSNAVARHLSERGIERGDRVGQYVGRSLQMVVGMLAVNKIGGVFVPLDPRSPTSRVKHIVEDSGIDLLLVSSQGRFSPQPLLDAGAVDPSSLVNIDEFEESNQDSPIEDISVYDTSATAYLIYTSGSTGKPKGVQVTHRSLINHNLACCDIYQLRSSDRVLQIASIGFDHSLEEIVPALVCGARVVLFPDHDGVSIEQLNRTLSRHDVTVFMPTTALWKVWAANSVRSAEFPFDKLRLCAIGGEKCPRTLLRQWLQLCGEQVTLQAGYGVTEAAITSTMWQPNARTLDVDLGHAVPIGIPIANTQLYVTDQYSRLLPVGAEGELHIGGEGVALGYWKNASETRKRFLPNLGDEDTGPVYKTGDIVKFTANGNLIYVTRNDTQIKIGGYRIELGEIEASVSRVTDVREAVVVANEQNAQTYLTAFVRMRAGATIDAHELSCVLPSYAVPQRIIYLSEFPLNSSAKVDRHALQRVAASHLDRISSKRNAKAAVTPTNGTDASLVETLRGVWQRTLAIESVRDDDDFFRLGGSSLHAVVMLDEVEKIFDLRVDINEFMKCPTFIAMVRTLSASSEKTICDAVARATQVEHALAIASEV